MFSCLVFSFWVFKKLFLFYFVYFLLLWFFGKRRTLNGEQSSTRLRCDVGRLQIGDAEMPSVLSISIRAVRPGFRERRHVWRCALSSTFIPDLKYQVNTSHAFDVFGLNNLPKWGNNGKDRNQVTQGQICSMCLPLQFLFLKGQEAFCRPEGDP